MLSPGWRPHAANQLLSARLVGRAEERRELLAAVDAAPRRGGALVLLGEAGIGKSRLLHEARQLARERGLPLMWGRATHGAGPLGPVQEAVAAGFRALAAPARRELLPVRAVLAQLAGEWTGQAADPSPLTVAESLLRFLAVISRDCGAVVVLEDLHWAEPETLTVARYLLDNVDDHGALCLVSLRPEPGAALTMARRLADTRAAALLEIGPLADAEVDDMVLACLHTDAAPDALLEFVRAHADGVPFVVEELLAGLARTGGLLRVDGGWHLVGHRMKATVPATVAESVDRRLETVHPRTRHVLQAAALLGQQLDAVLLGRLTGLDEETVLAALREAGYAQLLDGSGTEVRFRHALTRDRVAALLLPPERVALARRAAAAVRDAHPDLPGPWCELVASLAEQAGDTVAAARHLVESGRRAQARGALDTATVRLERALQLYGPAAPEASVARAVLAQVRALAGDVEGALRLAPPPEGPTDGSRAPDEDAELQLALVRALLTAGRLTEARERITEVLRGAAEIRPGVRLRALVLAAEIDVADGDTESARRRAGAVLARSADDLPEVRCAALEVTGRAARLRNVQEAEQAFAAALAVADRHGLPVWRARALHELGTVDLFDSMRTDRLEAARRAAVRTGAPATVAVVDFHLAEALVARGRTAEGRAAAERAEALARRLGSAVRAPSLVTLARSWAHERHADRMEEALARAADAAPGDPGIEAGAWGRARAMLALHEGDREAALDHLDRAVTCLRALPGHHFPHWGLWALLQTLGSPGRSAAARDEAAAAAGADTRFNRALIGAAHGVAAGQGGHTDVAAERWNRATDELRGYVDADWLVHLTSWLVAPAALRDGWGRPLADLQDAVRWFAAQSTHPLATSPMATSCRRLLRDAGGRVPRRGRGVSPVPPMLVAAGVTSREADVLRLIGRHVSNRAIAEALVLSPRTIEKHVAGLLRKTGATDRATLSELAASLPDPENPYPGAPER